MRITTSVIMFYIWVSASAGVLQSAGIPKQMGVNIDGAITMERSLEQAISGLQSIESGGFSFESLVGIYDMVAGAVGTFIGALSAGPEMMVAIGVPGELVAILSLPLAFLGARLGIYALSERDL